MIRSRTLYLAARDLDIAQDPTDMSDVDRPGGEEAEMVLHVRGDDNITFRYLEGHVDERSPFKVWSDLSRGLQHATGNLQERFDLNISHQDDVSFFIEDGDCHNPVEFFYLPYDPDSGFIQDHLL